MKLDKLKVMICDGGKLYTGADKTKVVRVCDGTKTRLIKFGRHFGTKAIFDRIPIIYTDRAYDERRSKKKVG